MKTTHRGTEAPRSFRRGTWGEPRRGSTWGEPYWVRRASLIRLAPLALAILLVLWHAPNPQAQGTVVLSAMADELDRSMKELRLPDQPSPYFIEYTIEDRLGTRITARLGAIVEDLVGRSRTLRVSVRVGDYAFDNSLFNVGNLGGGVVQLQGDGSTTAPLDDDYDTMRRQIWLATDVAYRRAVTTFARKKAAFQNRVDAAFVPDFSREQPEQTILTGLPLAVVNRDWPERAKQISAGFNDARAIENSEVVVADTRGTRYYLNSEGSRLVAPVQIATLRVSADTRATDGMVLRDGFTFIEKELKDLPSVGELTARARAMANRLRDQRTAEFGEEYTGPVLVEGQAAGEIVASTLAPALLGRRPAENAGGGGRGGGGRGGQASPFLSRIGLRVLTDSFTVKDTPSLQQYDGRPVPGAYVVDEHGIKAKDVTLVDKGRLVTLLAGRAPLRGMLQSSGHTRGGDVQPGVLDIESSEAITAAALRRRYFDLLETQDKEFGYILRAVANPADVNGGGAPGQVITQAVRVTRDGRETPVRGLRLVNMAPPVFRDVLDASRERTLYTWRVTNIDAASAIVPNMIFEELEIQRTREITQRPPVVRSPLED